MFETLSSAQLFAGYAEVYDDLLGFPPYVAHYDEVLDRAGIRPPMHVLDLCTGTGEIIERLRQHACPCRVTAVDSSPDMLAQAQLKAVRFRCYGGEVRLPEANLDSPWGDWAEPDTYDRIICMNGLYALADPPSVLVRLAPLGTSSARLIISTPRPNPSIDALLAAHLGTLPEGQRAREKQQLLHQLQKVILYNQEILRRFGDRYHAPTEAELRGWFADSGWSIEHFGTTYGGQNWLVEARKET
jgi:ubiquinone/menaquinone biosynthesis C-methylase UbiE